jgi:hypothetical protein
LLSEEKQNGGVGLAQIIQCDATSILSKWRRVDIRDEILSNFIENDDLYMEKNSQHN